MGFLPSRLKLNLFYLARGLRINLNRFKLSSENRRINRKTEDISLKVVDLEDFKYHYSIGKLASDFYKERFGKGVMSAFKIKWLITSGACTHIIVYIDKSEGGKIVGYCPSVMNSNLLHYAYPFYDLNYLDKNVGMGMMLKSVMFAKNKDLKFTYLGTVYTRSSLYKVQFTGAEYFTGFGWSDDIAKLKELVLKGIKGHFLKERMEKDKIFKNEGIEIEF
jgi:arginyl-tRNA--protein-N-Asp/Glu arginylyltransferase